MAPDTDLMQLNLSMARPVDARWGLLLLLLLPDGNTGGLNKDQAVTWMAGMNAWHIVT